MSDGDPLDRFGAPGLDVGGAVRALRDTFAIAGIEAASVEARILVGRVLGLDLTGLTVGARRPVAVEAAERLVAAARRRVVGEPVQRIIGSAEFFGRAFALTSETLVPRADTETLIEVILRRFPADERFVFADLGVGSGAILVTILAERPGATAVATDLSAEALETARTNAEAYGVADRATFVRASYATALAPDAFDAIVSNPPYIASAEIDTLDREVRSHDPRLALDGGTDGLDAYRAIAPQASPILKPGGLLAVEIGWRQAAAVAAILADAGFEAVTVTQDLSGRDRVVSGRRGVEGTRSQGTTAGGAK